MDGAALMVELEHEEEQDQDLNLEPQHCKIGNGGRTL